MLHLALKAFYPAPAAVPAAARRHHLEVPGRCTSSATGWRRERGLELLVYKNPEGVAQDINPFDHGSAIHTDIWKTAGAEAGARPLRLRRRLRRRAARRGEVAAPRSASSRSAPRSTAGTRRTSAPSCGASTTPASTRARSIRVFPLSNWTELDVWQYIYLREDPDRAAVLRRRAAGGRARRHADHGRRRPHAAAARRGAEMQAGPLPHARLLPADRRDRERRRRRCPRSSRRCCSPRTSERQGRVIDHDQRGVDGEEEAGGVLLMAHIIAT